MLPHCWVRPELVKGPSPGGFDGLDRMLGKKPLGHGNGIATGAYRMHPDAPHPSQREHRGKRGGGIVTFLGRPWASIGVGKKPAKKGLT
jgi:hypothetical protein